MTPSFDIYNGIYKISQELVGNDKVTDYTEDLDNLPIIHITEGTSSDGASKALIGVVNMTVNVYGTRKQRQEVDRLAGQVRDKILGGIPEYNYNITSPKVNITTVMDTSTGQVLVRKRLDIRLTYTKKPVDVEPTEPIVIWAELYPIEEGSLTITGTGTPNERILIFISGDLVRTHTMRIDENGEFRYVQGYSLKGGDIIKVLRLADGKEMSTYEVVAEGDEGGEELEYTPIEDFEYGVMGIGVMVITKYKGKDMHVNIPPEIEGRRLNVIGKGAFLNKKLYSIKIPETVESLGTETFTGNNLITVGLPTGLKGTLGDSLFLGNSLREVIIPEGITRIGNNTFLGNALLEVVLPRNLEVIGSSAFSGNVLREVVIPDRVTSIGNFAFSNNQLERVVIPPSVKYIGRGAFDNDVEIIHEDE